MVSTQSPLYKTWIGLCIAYPLVILTSIAATNILLVIILVGWIFFHSNIPVKKARWFLIPVAAYLTWTLIAVAVSPFESRWGDWLEERSTFLAIIPGLVLGSRVTWVRRSFRYAGIFLCAVAVYAALQYFTGFNLLGDSTDLFSYGNHFRAEGLQNNPQTFAGMIALTLPVSLAVFSGATISVLLLVLAGAASVTASMTRTMILGFIGGGGIMAFLGSRKLRFAGLLLIVSAIILPQTVFRSAGERLESGDQTRIMLWKSALNIIQAYPWTGVGENNWNEAFALYGEPYDQYKNTCHAHSDLLTSAVENGVIGGVIFLLMWGAVVLGLIRSVLRTRGPDRDLQVGFLTAVIIILFAGLFQNYQTDAEDALLMWFVVGTGVQMAGMNAVAPPAEDEKMLNR